MIEDVTKSATREVRAEDRNVRVERSAVGVLRGKDVEVSQAGIGLVLADGDVSITQGGGRAFVARGDLRIQQGGGSTLIAGGDASIRQGGTGSVLTLGAVSVEQGGIGVALAREVRAGGGGIIGLALAPSLDVQPGGRVILLAGDADLEAAAQVAAKVGGGPPELVELAGSERRSLLVVPKVEPTPDGFPRRAGMARKRPLA